MIFQSLQLKFQKGPARHYSSESQTSQKTPWKSFNFCMRSLVAKTDQGGGFWPDSGGRACRRRGGSWGKVRGTRGLPSGGRGWGRDGRRRRGHGLRRPAVVASGGGGAPEALGGSGQA